MSFIPKKALDKPIYRGQGFGFFLTISFVALLISGLIFAGAYFYEKTLDKNVNQLKESLKRAEDILDLAFVAEIQELGAKIKAAKELLNNYKQTTTIFTFLEQATLQNVRFSSFKFSYSESANKSSAKIETVAEPVVFLKGTARGYTDLALQSREFQKNQYVKSAVFSNFALKEEGLVDFEVKITFDPSYLIYQVKE